MEFGILGPLVVVSDAGHEIRISSPKVRALLAVLLCRSNRPVRIAELIDALWDSAPPPKARDGLRVHLHHLRRAIGAARIGRRPEGYQLLVAPGELDVDRFRTLVADARSGTARQDPERTGNALGKALALWRGPALAGVDQGQMLGAEARRLEDLRLETLEQYFEAELALGRYVEISSDLRSLTTQHPTRETFRGQLMRALAGRGLLAEAAEVFEATRAVLADQLGLDPGPRLRELHLAILREDPALVSGLPTSTAAAPGTVVPRQLPAHLVRFVGRGAYLERLDALVAASGRDAVAMPVVTISGPAGIGKTTLGVYWAHRVAARFPDGQLYLDLRGFDPSHAPITSATALANLLVALGVPTRSVPVEAVEREGLYRSLLADRRVLVVLDNAHDAAQVRPLLPGSVGCLAVVTSRKRLSGLVASGARPLLLDFFDADEAGELLRDRLGADAVAREADAMTDLVARCGGLPLALSIVAARAEALQGMPLRDLAGEISRTRRTLDAFAGDDPNVDLRAVFSWSYQALSAPAARMFRLLALHPGPDVTTPAAASAAGVSAGSARAALTELLAASLLQLSRPGRYAYHDLIRAYAREVAEVDESPDERSHAQRRILAHYLQTAAAATLLLDSNQSDTAVDTPTPGVNTESIRTRRESLDWFDAERDVISAAVTGAPAGFESQVWQLAWNSIAYLDRSGRWHEKIVMLRAALAPARQAGKPAMEAHILRAIGRTYGRMHQYETAYEYSQASIDRCRESGDVRGELHATNTYAETLEFEGRHGEAVAKALEVLELARDVGDKLYEARALSAIAYNFGLAGEPENAIDPCWLALELFVELDDTDGRAAIHDSIGVAYQQLGRHREAVAQLRLAHELTAEAGERFNEAIVLDHLGDAYRATEETADAAEAWRRALAIFVELGVREADAVREKLAGLST